MGVASRLREGQRKEGGVGEPSTPTEDAAMVAKSDSNADEGSARWAVGGDARDRRRRGRVGYSWAINEL